MNAVELDTMGVRHVAKAAETRDTWELGMTITCTFSILTSLLCDKSKSHTALHYSLVPEYYIILLHIIDITIDLTTY